MTVKHRHGRPASADAWVLGLLVIAAFVLGGGSRADVLSLIVLRPISALGCAYAIWRTDWATVVHHRWVVGLGAAILLIPALHLLPLPPAIWTQLPGRDVLTSVDKAVGLAPGWRPLSMAPDATSNALLSLLLPASILLLGLRLERRDLIGIGMLVVALALCSAALGILQVIGGNRNALYLYRITNFDSAVGLFANRNHQAMLLATMLPMITIIQAASDTVESARLRLLWGMGIALALVVVILATGSRAGLLLGIFGLIVAGALLVRSKQVRDTVRHFRGNGRLIAVAAVGLAGVAIALVVGLGRAQSVDRLVDTAGDDELRFRVWGPIARMVAEYFPWGTGAGVFVEPYQIVEPDVLLSPTYLNHAHNDWLETVLTGGLPALLLLATAIVMFGLAVKRTAALRSDRSALVGWTGLSVIGMLALASVGDYPLRVPSMVSIFALMVAFVSNALAPPRSDLTGTEYRNAA